MFWKVRKLVLKSILDHFPYPRCINSRNGLYPAYFQQLATFDDTKYHQETGHHHRTVEKDIPVTTHISGLR